MTPSIRVLAVATSLLAAAVPANAAPALWEVSDGDSKIWLFGSFHLLPPATEWRTDIFERTMAGADRVYFETDVGSAVQGAILAKAMAMGLNPLGTTLSSQLDTADATTLRSTITRLGLPVGTIQAMQPWLATNMISTAVIVALGYDPNSGVDIALQRELPRERKAYFETSDEQLSFLASAPQEEQVGMLVDTLDKLDYLPGQLDAMVTAWAAGTPDVMADAFFDDLAGYDAFTQRLIFDRNQTWVAKIDTMLADNEQDLIVVGAGHLVGDGSLVDLLEKSGFSVKRLQ
ncbi:MAG: TraB/GumN family protein [Devosia sp.]|uniref:TraB/GumN family protein n=1 Tax=Devosia sp. TaxID=1871048 RepID=UPI002608618D|nr:TraB/GumN family protein [Devosia sp.]MDB5588602.1 TraB/GumN family protein [Devosia sp.]